MFLTHKGVLWMIIATSFFAIMGTFVKIGSEFFSETELVFYRSAISLLLVALLIIRSKTTIKTNYIRLHFLRSITGFLSLLAFFYAISKLPLSSAISLNYTSPLFLSLLITIILKRKLNKFLFSIVCVGFFGTFLLLKPTFVDQNYFAGFMGLVSGFGAAFAYLYITQLGQLKEPDIRTVFYFTGFSTIGSAAMLFFEEINIPDFSQIYILVGLGLSATIAQIALTKAYRVGNTMGNAGLSYLTVIFSTLIGLIYFKEFLDLQSILGIFLIILSGIFSSKK
jgi:drug/metabolite transporter (DMT)-like permease|tara:strand:+ start:1713 stop:2555 length:843 start_codon:yes stop_codon:yes gene_type:complete